ncbi:protein FAM53A isoform X2 [Phodopus roborovskii]|uniref:protein FAM53A isoform X2 n=1 Tax=Phodopus roborovskii TaxID=109678 RepID=UPI0021E4F4E6|nr:protein FAM53A isoform X2 [Phodopus roborovskii]
MVTLITEKLQNQSLDDLTRRAHEAGPYSAEKLNKSGHLFPLEIGDKSPWKALHGGWPIGSQAASGPFPLGSLGVSHTEGLKWQLASPGPVDVGSFLDLRESTGPPAAPPTKRHCRSLSEPEELARCRSPWRPSGSKVWTPVSKRRCNSGGSATLQCRSGPGDPASPLTPRPASASSGFVDGSEGIASSGPPWLSAGPSSFSSRRRLSLSQEHLVVPSACLPSASSTPTSTPELGRHHGLLRCRSQPCVLDGRRVRRKRRREEDARWTRPSLDFLKMTRTLKNSKSLCSLDYEDDEDNTQAKTVVSSPCNSQGLVGIITPGSSPRIPRPGPTSPSAWASGEPEASIGEDGSSGEPSDWDSAGEDGIFPLDQDGLDLEQIESN